MFEASAALGRIALTLTAFEMGADLQAMLTGGSAHIGAVAFAETGGICRVFERADHREGDLARELGALLAAELGRNVAISCGIHYDAITSAEIAAVMTLANELARRLINSCRRKAMISVEQLDEFAEYIKSGELEREFRDCDETRRYQILELLEKFMDVSDLADAAATRIIYRGMQR